MTVKQSIKNKTSVHAAKALKKSFARRNIKLLKWRSINPDF